jgi:acyl-CoA synthetase (NDP forming)/GNAT superfamily N-acetyltransferase
VSATRDEWAASVVLSDGETAYIRPITPDDAPLLLAFHERQPKENLYRRFFSPKPTLTDDELQHFTDVDFVDRVALVMEQHGEFIAWASYERWKGRDDADVAFMVDADQQAKGIATLLLEHLAAIARSNGISRFTADVLADNRPMLRVFSRAGWPVERHFDSGVTEVEFPLTDTEQFMDSVEAREQRADSHAVARLLLPRTIAVIGASDQEHSIGHELWKHATHGFAGRVFPVNSRRETVGGQRAYSSVTEIDGEVNLAVIAVPPESLAATIDGCIAKRVRGAVVITATDGTEVDMPALVSHARRNGLRIIGPASMGIASTRPESSLQAALVDVRLPPGNVAVSMQSGSLGASLLRLADQLSLGLSWFVSLGDKSDISGNDLLQFWEDDEHTRVIAMYTETFGNPRKFARIARRVGRTRPIVAVRTGPAALGSATAALYQQAGLVEVPTVRALLDAARSFASQPVPAGPRVAILTNSRSPGVLAEAAVRAVGLEVVEPPRRLDWRSSADDFGDAVRAALAADTVDSVLVVHAPPIASAYAPVEEIDAAAADSAKPVLAVMIGRPDGPIREGSSIPSFSFPEPAAGALARMYRYSHWLATEADAPTEPIADVDGEVVATILERALAKGETVLSLTETRAVLDAYGIAMPESVLAVGTPMESIVAIAEQVGFPVAVKTTVRRVGRSARAGVALDLAEDEAVRDAVDVIRSSLGDDARSLIIQAMVPPGVDVRIHCTTDDRLGPVVTVGLGSLQTDGLADGVSRLAPVSEAGAAGLIEGSVVCTAFNRAGIDAAPLRDAIRRVAQLVLEHPEIASIDINPAIVSDAGCFATDVRIEVAPHDEAEPPIRRLV